MNNQLYTDNGNLPPGFKDPSLEVTNSKITREKEVSTCIKVSQAWDKTTQQVKDNWIDYCKRNQDIEF